jgi:hypothetical protein
VDRTSRRDIKFSNEILTVGRATNVFYTVRLELLHRENRAICDVMILRVHPFPDLDLPEIRVTRRSAPNFRVAQSWKYDGTE